jgi:mannose-6-phosphate isomerase
MKMEPIVVIPLPMTRVWGGRQLETKYHRDLPDGDPYGESWEMVDREDEQSVVAEGSFAGRTLHDLWTNEREVVFGGDLPDSERFPLLIKILDARDDLSIQVHPPAEKAEALHGEPKTEMWYIADAAPGARLYVGLKAHSSREAFAQAIGDGSVADHVHEIPVSAGDSIFIPSGRLHAIGAGLLIFEIQQNSDTTYRVFDWNRMGLDGKPRELHIEQSMESIDFSDVEPSGNDRSDALLAACELFHVERIELETGGSVGCVRADRFCMLHIVEGTLLSAEGKRWATGQTLLLPVNASLLLADGTAVVLRTTIP